MKKSLLLAFCLLAISENAVAGKARRAPRGQIAKSSRGGVAHQAKHEQPRQKDPMPRNNQQLQEIMENLLTIPEKPTVEGLLKRANTSIEKLSKLQKIRPSNRVNHCIRIANRVKRMVESFRKPSQEEDLSALFANLNLGDGGS